MWCWWCCHPFEGTALSMPHKHDERRNKFYTSGNFCSWSCMKTYTIDKYIWGGNFITSNCNLCPETYKLLSKIDGIHVAGFSLMKGGVTLKEHVDFIGDEYLFTYHLGIKCPEKCILHHAEMGDITEENGKHIYNSSEPMNHTVEYVVSGVIASLLWTVYQFRKGSNISVVYSATGLFISAYTLLKMLRSTPDKK